MFCCQCHKSFLLVVWEKTCIWWYTHGWLYCHISYRNTYKSWHTHMNTKRGKLAHRRISVHPSNTFSVATLLYVIYYVKISKSYGVLYFWQLLHLTLINHIDTDISGVIIQAYVICLMVGFLPLSLSYIWGMLTLRFNSPLVVIISIKKIYYTVGPANYCSLLKPKHKIRCHLLCLMQGGTFQAVLPAT